MHLDPTETDRLLLFSAAELARRTRRDGAQLSAPEAIAIASDEMHRAARRGASYDEVVVAGRTAVAPDDLLPGVGELVPELRLEVLLDEGTRLIVLPSPFGGRPVDGVELASQPVVVNAGRQTRRLRVHNTSSRPVRVSSHFPFWDVNARLVFDRAHALGYRLDLPAGDSVRWAPDEVLEVTLVADAVTDEDVGGEDVGGEDVAVEDAGGADRGGPS